MYEVMTVTTSAPFFGVDTEEVECLRKLASTLRTARSNGDMEPVWEALAKVNKVQRNVKRKRKN